MDSIKGNHKEFLKNSEWIFKTEQRFKSERRNAFTEEFNSILLNSYYDKTMQPIDSIEIYAYGIVKDLVSEAKRLSVAI